ncbi:ATP-binding cassette domain-containing protein [Ectobacillus antri]|uniref:ATP-binding cassette domain-containing protein n=1 Tax=Ectobacillus antri TaxID=2486280 RepID=A0ABT6H6N9_9BACI|nr:ATP-binding cassette domain-containing protein [Ectobacillus antri]MDG4657308.1 ATP-binding cassette domain-containing protein [Ectobacillus antri]MDG5754340.1 ATP-binding cassette domain-containing protein [Ectobacillus antri]
MNYLNYAITLSGVSKKVKKQLILDNITLNLEKNKSYGFVGYNGSGKSMLFKVICGFTSYSSGSVTVNGKVIGKDVDFIEDAGVIIETPEFLPKLTGYENLLLLSEIRRQISKEQILHSLKIVGLEQQANKLVGKYSLGMKQRLRIAQAIMENQSILILDEPFNGLDKKGLAEMQNLLLELKKNKTILLTSHSEGDISLLCDTVFEIESGKIIGEERITN